MQCITSDSGGCVATPSNRSKRRYQVTGESSYIMTALIDSAGTFAWHAGKSVSAAETCRGLGKTMTAATYHASCIWI